MKVKSGFPVSALGYFAYPLVLVISVLLFSMPASAQQMKGSYWEIMKKDSSTISVKSKAMDVVKHDTLWLRQNDKATGIPVDSIIHLKRIKKGTVVRGLIIGGAIGAVITAAILTATGWYSYRTDPRAVAINAGGLMVGAGIGSIIGSAASKDKVYDVALLSLSEKSQIIEQHCKHY